MHSLAKLLRLSRLGGLARGLSVLHFKSLPDLRMKSAMLLPHIMEMLSALNRDSADFYKVQDVHCSHQ